MKITYHPEDETSVTMETAAPFLEMAEMLKQQLPKSNAEKSAEHIMERISERRDYHKRSYRA